MTRRVSAIQRSFLPSLLAIFSLGCVGVPDDDSPQGDTGDTVDEAASATASTMDTGTGSSGSSGSTTTATGAETGTTNAETTNAGTTEMDTGGASGDTSEESGVDDSQCPDRQPRDRVKTAIDFAAWAEAIANKSEDVGIELEYAGECRILEIEDQTEDRAADDILVWLDCVMDDGESPNSELRLYLRNGEIRRFPLEVDQRLSVTLHWQSSAYHRRPSTTVVLRDPARDGAILHAGVFGQHNFRVQDALAPWTVEVLDTGCEGVCVPEWCELGPDSLSHPQIVRISHDGRTIVELDDANVGLFEVDGIEYMYDSSMIMRHDCLNCWSSYEYAWTARIDD